jgi:hypothetical protein
LPDDPHQWPFSRVRLAGLWQQGGERQAVLTAAGHSVMVAPGQRVTLEGHRVVAITDEGVHLRLRKGPWLPLAWAEVRQAGPTAGLAAGQWAGPSTPAYTTGSQK